MTHLYHSESTQDQDNECLHVCVSAGGSPPFTSGVLLSDEYGGASGVTGTSTKSGALPAFSQRFGGFAGAGGAAATVNTSRPSTVYGTSAAIASNTYGTQVIIQGTQYQIEVTSRRPLDLDDLATFSLRRWQQLLYPRRRDGFLQYRSS